MTKPPVPVRLRVFGGLRMWRAGVEVDIGPPRQRVVLAALVAARGAVTPIGELIELVWGTQPSTSAINQSHRLIGQVRRLFEPGLASRAPGSWVLPVGDGYRLMADAGNCDLIRFGELVRAGDYHQALDIAQEPLFAGLDAGLLEHPVFVALERERIDAALAAADQALAGPDGAGYVPMLERIAASAPLHEPLQARLIRLLTATGRRAEALVLFDQTRQRLAGDLGVDPGAELTAAYRLALAEEEPRAAVAPDRPAQLPPRVAGFTARRELTAGLGHTHGVVVLSGMGGVGKTALAVDWAHRVAARFPDGALYLNLRGFDPGGRLVPPVDALGTLLESAGVNPLTVPRGLDARAARFRSAMAGRRMIVLLDNAHDSDHVRPLLPGAAGTLTIVTSRNRLTGLVAREGAHPVHVGRLPDAAARELLARRLGAPRLDAEPEAVDQLVRLCAGLPLALSIAAARVAVNPRIALTRMVAELGTPQHRLDALDTGEPDDDVRSAFSWSYRALSPAAARLFRLLAVHPGGEMSLKSLAALGAVPATLAELAAANMITEVAGRRYTVHDLLRLYAGELLVDGDERGAAEDRLIEHYVHSARNAYLTFRRPAIAGLEPPAPGLTPEEPADFPAAVGWFMAERDTVDAVVDLALRRGRVRDAALITLDLHPLRTVRAEPPPDYHPRVQRVLDAAAGSVEPDLLAGLLREAAYGVRGSDAGRYVDYLTRALEISQRTGDVAGESHAWRILSRSRLASLAERVDYSRRAVETARRCGEPSLLAISLSSLAAMLEEVPRWDEVVELSEESLAIAVEHDLVDLQTEPAGRLSEVHTILGNHARAAEMAEWALARTPDNDVFSLFPLAAGLAVAALGTGDRDRARGAAERFRRVAEQYGDVYRRLWGDEMVDDYLAKVAEVEAALS